LLPAELRLRDYVAKQQLKAMKNLASLASHAAADTGRRNRDWKYNTGSADLNLIPDVLVLEGRARQMVRDSWIAKSIIKAYKRNIAGRGIVVTPHAKKETGEPLVKLNEKAQREFARWGKCKEACDVEKKQTFGQMQRLAVGERATVGEHFWVWSYTPPLTPSGKIDLSKPCGLRIQRFEPEQLDYRILSFQNNEVRGGVELDENGAAVAYHFFTRNPNDYLFRRAFWSVRIPRERVFHYAYRRAARLP
jgi:capsid protein